MARIKPFKAVRPAPDKVHLVASRSYVSYEPEKLVEKLDSNPFTFIHIINPDYKNESNVKGGTPEMFKKVKSKYADFKEHGILIKEKNDSLYIYQQTTPNNSYTGIIAGVSVSDYKAKVIKIHESTLEKREKLFTDYLDHVDFNAEPVLLAHEKNETLTALISKVKEKTAVYNFSTTDKYKHTLWRVDSINEISAFQNALLSVKNLYIADGHHRSASSVNLGIQKNNLNPNANSNWFLAMLTQEDEMRISGFHRLIRGIDRTESDQIIRKINEEFDLESITTDVYTPNQGEIHVYYFGTGWAKLKLNKIDSNSPKDQIDAEKLSAQILEPHAGILDLKNDSRIKFIPDSVDLVELTKQLDNGNDILFLLAPVTFSQLKSVADADEFMPPKSTYIEPKLRSGLTIFEISDE